MARSLGELAAHRATRPIPRASHDFHEADPESAASQSPRSLRWGAQAAFSLALCGWLALCLLGRERGDLDTSDSKDVPKHSRCFIEIGRVAIASLAPRAWGPQREELAHAPRTRGRNHHRTARASMQQARIAGC
jgi:hypothetical protein